jgi:uncharacterized membrane protein
MLRFKLLAFSLVVTILLIMIVFFAYCLSSGNKEIVMRMIEIIVTALLSGSSGYVIGKTRNEQQAAGASETG